MDLATALRLAFLMAALATTVSVSSTIGLLMYFDVLYSNTQVLNVCLKTGKSTVACKNYMKSSN